MDPEVMLFDELPRARPNSSARCWSCKNWHRRKNRGRHPRMSFARNVSSHVIFLHQGKIAEEGPPTEIFERPKSERLRQFLAGG